MMSYQNVKFSNLDFKPMEAQTSKDARELADLDLLRSIVLKFAEEKAANRSRGRKTGAALPIIP